MIEKDEDEKGSSLFELTKFLGSGWKPVSVRTQRSKEGRNTLKQTITLSYVKVRDPPEGEEKLKNGSNVQIKVFNE